MTFISKWNFLVFSYINQTKNNTNLFIYNPQQVHGPRSLISNLSDRLTTRKESQLLENIGLFTSGSLSLCFPIITWLSDIDYKRTNGCCSLYCILPGVFQKCRISGSTLDLLNQNLHFIRPTMLLVHSRV